MFSVSTHTYFLTQHMKMFYEQISVLSFFCVLLKFSHFQRLFYTFMFNFSFVSLFFSFIYIILYDYVVPEYTEQYKLWKVPRSFEYFFDCMTSDSPAYSSFFQKKKNHKHKDFLCEYNASHIAILVLIHQTEN